jgi:hypothetical protein
VEVLDPALFVYAFLRRDDETAGDAFCSLLSRTEDLYALTEPGPDARVSDIDSLVVQEIVDSGDEFALWLNRLGHGPGAEVRQALGYSLGDTLTFHAVDSRRGTYDFGGAWQTLSPAAGTLIGELASRVPDDSFWGLNCCYGVLVPDKAYRSLSLKAVEGLLAGIGYAGVRMEQLTMGQLWLVASGWIGRSGLDPALTATWVVLGPESARGELQAALHDVSRPLPPELPALFAARQKFYAQLSRYRDEKKEIRRAGASLDEQTRELQEFQRELERHRFVIGSEGAELLRRKTAGAFDDAVAFEQAVTRIADLTSTLRISVRNYRELAPRLVDPRGSDELFGPEQLFMEKKGEELTFDLAYFESAVQRRRSTLQAAEARFNISQERQATESVRLATTQVSAIAGSFMALVATEAILPLFGGSEKRPVVAFNVIILALVGSFAVAQVLLTWRRLRSSLTGFAVAGTLGLVPALVLAAVFVNARSLPAWYVPAAAAAFAVVSWASYRVFRLFEERLSLQ